MAMQEAQISLRPSASAPAMSRRVLDGLRDGISEEVLEDARLLLTELVTNSIRHGGLRAADRITVYVRREPGGLLVEVADPGGGFAIDSWRVSGSGGWGLLLLDQLAREWGVENRPAGGTTVWFRVGVPDT